MGKSTVNNMLSSIKRRVDYDIVDDDLDTLLLDCMDDGLRQMKQWLFENDLKNDVSQSGSFKTIAGQSYRDITKAVIVGDLTTFTGQAGDTIDVHIDGTDYDDIDIAACTTIALVVIAINAITGGSEASTDDNGYLQILSGTTGSTSIVTIADGTSTGQTVIAELFSVAAERTQSAITDVDEIYRLTERVNQTAIDMIDYFDLIAMNPKPSSSTASTPNVAALWDDKIFFYPTPSAANLVYIDYYIKVTTPVAGASLPFDQKYDAILKQYCRVEFFAWKFSGSPQAPPLMREEGKLKLLVDQIIVNSAKNIGKNRGQRSRRSGGTPGPRRVISS